MVPDNSYSRLVAWLKVILPLTALAILSSIFLVSRRVDPESAIPYSDVEISERLREPRLTLPVFDGMTDTGAAVKVTARDMRPLPGSLTEGSATGLTVRMEDPDGSLTTLNAATGQIDTEASRVDLGGGVVMTTAGGYRLTAPEMTAMLSPQDLTATGGVFGDSPFGTIRSDRMHLRPDPEAPGANLLDFIGAVRLVYLPQS